MEKRRLPVGIQTFSRIREEGYYYVDKTGYARRLAEEGGGRAFPVPRGRGFRGRSSYFSGLTGLGGGGGGGLARPGRGGEPELLQ